MSFSNRLTTFFVLMVLIPIIGIGVLGFRLIGATDSGRAGARAGGLVTAASQLYASDETSARSAAQAVAEEIIKVPSSRLDSEIAQAADDAGLVRVTVRRDGSTVATYGTDKAVAPGTVEISDNGVTTTVTASVTTAASFAQAVSGPLSAAVLTSNGRVLASTLSATPPPGPPPAKVTLGGVPYATDTYKGLAGFDHPVTLTMLSAISASNVNESNSDLIVALFLAGLALLAFGFAVLASRGLNEMVKRFLSAATRLANRDFSVRVPVEGNDEFARLGSEFNNMSDQLQAYIKELDAERERLRESIRLTGETFASSLDKKQLEAITLEAALTGVVGQFGRMAWREEETNPLKVVRAEGAWREAGPQIVEAERAALNGHAFGESTADDLHVMAARMGTLGSQGLAHGTLSVGRRGEPFTDGDRQLFRSLAAQSFRALENVRLHDEADRKAVTDLLTGLSNHGHFQSVLSHEMEDVRRYHYPVGLILLDLDNFKKVNDTYGHPQGDAVLKAVAGVLTRQSREGDTAARYGGEEMALVLPHTDLEGAFAIAERVRREIEGMAVTRVDGSGDLKVTASIGVSATTGSEKDELIAEADAALYRAKRGGKNRTERAGGSPNGLSTGSFMPEMSGGDE